MPLCSTPGTSARSSSSRGTPKVAHQVVSGRPISLGSVVRWEDAPYANGILDTVISPARRDRPEYGQAQLRLVVAFLRWHDLKGEREERISSPLLLAAGDADQAARRPRQLPSCRPNHPRPRSTRPSATTSGSCTTSSCRRPSTSRRRGVAGPPRAARRRRSPRTEPAVELAPAGPAADRADPLSARSIRLEAFQRRAGRGNATVGRRAYAYSYRRRDYRPLGVQIYLDRVVHPAGPLAAMASARRPSCVPAMAPRDHVKRGPTYVARRHRGRQPLRLGPRPVRASPSPTSTTAR